MDSTLRERARNRNLATSLLRDLTILTAVAGLAATTGFGWLASMTYVGGSSATAPEATLTTNDTVPTAAAKAAPNATASARPAAVATPRPTTGTGGSNGSTSAAARQAPPRVDRAPTSRPEGRDPMLEQAHWRALGTNVHLLVLDGDLAAARARVERVLADVDAAYSRFRPDSELMRLQAAPGHLDIREPAPVGRHHPRHSRRARHRRCR